MCIHTRSCSRTWPSSKELDVHDEIEFMPLEPASAAGADGTDLRRLYDVPVELAVEIGRTRMTIGQTLELRPGSVVSLNRLAGEPVDLLINGKDRKSTRLNSSHANISYAVFCLKKKTLSSVSPPP